MPIRPDLKSLYPADWPEISHRIRFERAGGRCEICRRPHGQKVYCLPDGRWYDAGADAWVSGRGTVVDVPAVPELMRMRVVRVVLTCAHIAHDPRHSADDDLAAWCSRCHLIHDAGHHAIQRRLTIRLRSAIGDLFTGLYSLVGYPDNRHQ
jgi:hypothetical protein